MKITKHVSDVPGDMGGLSRGSEYGYGFGWWGWATVSFPTRKLTVLLEVFVTSLASRGVFKEGGGIFNGRTKYI